MVYADVPVCFGSKEFNVISRICKSCDCYHSCRAVVTGDASKKQ